MNYPSPRTPGTTPQHEWDYSRMPSATPTPSPRPNWFDTTPRRPATRAAHSRVNSYSYQPAFSPRPPKDSPRYNSSGEYATVDVSPKPFSSSRRPSGSAPRNQKRERSYSYTYVRASTPYGESDEDEIIEAYGRTYVLPAKSRYKTHKESKHNHHHHHHQPEYESSYWYTNYDDYQQGGAAYYADPVYVRESSYDSPLPHHQPQYRPPTSFGHQRRSSTSVPQRSSTVRPSSSYRAKPPPAPKATETDARRHRIPAGYSLKNWDPNEEPILLLGSVFDANTLGKWIYDWTVYREGPATPIADMAGELWLLLIQLAGKIKRAEETVGKVRSAENREIMEEFIDAGERINDNLRSLLKSCEAPMLRAAKKKQAGLGKNSGVEFVDTMFGRDRELSRTERFMQKVRLFNLRFDANCEEIVLNPTL